MKSILLFAVNIIGWKSDEMIISWLYVMAQKQDFEVRLSKNISSERLQSSIKHAKTMLELHIL